MSHPPSAADEEDLIGSTFAGRYRPLRLLARGSMGRVYLADALGPGGPVRRVALKVVSSPTPMNDPRVSRFRQEASQLARLAHENIVRLYDHGVDADRAWLAMEYVEGPTLRTLMMDGELTPLRSVRIAQQVCAGLALAHDLGLIHRDLKPANIIVSRAPDGSDVVKIVDFGLVKDTLERAQLTAEGQMLGTPMFMAPEQVRGQPIDARCDVYALGMVLYRAMTGEWPFPDDDATAVLLAQLHKDPAPFDQAAPWLLVPDVVEWTVLRCLEKDRDRRFRDVRELGRALRLCEAALLDASTVTSLTGVHLLRGKVVVPSNRRNVAQRQRWAEGIALFTILGLTATCMSGGTFLGFALVKGLELATLSAPPAEPPPAAIAPPPIERRVADAPSAPPPTPEIAPEEPVPADAGAVTVAPDVPSTRQPRRRAPARPSPGGALAGDLVDPWSEVRP